MLANLSILAEIGSKTYFFGHLDVQSLNFSDAAEDCTNQSKPKDTKSDNGICTMTMVPVQRSQSENGIAFYRVGLLLIIVGIILGGISFIQPVNNPKAENDKLQKMYQPEVKDYGSVRTYSGSLQTRQKQESRRYPEKQLPKERDRRAGHDRYRTSNSRPIRTNPRMPPVSSQPRTSHVRNAHHNP